MLGVLDEPEPLKTQLGSFETIGRKLANDCSEGTTEMWGHSHLKHNAAELERLRTASIRFCSRKASS